MNIWQQKIASILSTENYLFQFTPELPKDTAALKTIYQSEDTIAIYEALGGKGNLSRIPMALPDFWIGDQYLIIDDALSFNRYRLATLRSPVYQQISSLDIDNYRRYCRQFEKECLKSGVKATVWSDKLSELHFGAASAPGDFFANGGPGWKSSALSDYLLDVYALASGLSLIRLPIYANLMVAGRLERLDKILIKGDEQSGKYIAQHLARLLTK